jgi:hypothetical protein
MITDTDMDLVKKTTILLPRIGATNWASGREQYFRTTREERLAAVAELAAMSLPIGTPKQMEAESVPQPEPLPS